MIDRVWMTKGEWEKRNAAIAHEQWKADRARRAARVRMKGHRTFTVMLWLVVMVMVSFVAPGIVYGSLTAFAVTVVVTAVGVSRTRQVVRRKRLADRAARRAARAVPVPPVRAMV